MYISAAKCLNVMGSEPEAKKCYFIYAEISTGMANICAYVMGIVAAASSNRLFNHLSLLIFALNGFFSI